MKQVKYYNRLIIDSNYNRVFLFHESELKEVAYNNEAYDYAPCYRVNDSGYMERAEDYLTEDDFKDLYYRADENDKVEDIEYYETLFDDELQPFVRANWDNHEHYYLLSLEHGINTTEYDFIESSVEIIEGTCYLASEHIDQEYPRPIARTFTSSFQARARNTISNRRALSFPMSRTMPSSLLPRMNFTNTIDQEHDTMAIK